MPAISKIRFTNVVYEGGNKRYNDELFQFDGHNGAILLENGGGKTVFIQTAMQAVLPHGDLAGRKLKDTLSLENGPAHIAIEWILNERPRRYVVTCISLFLTATGLDSYRYMYDYPALDPDSIDHIPFAKISGGKPRAADKGEICDYYQGMAQKRVNARMPGTIKEYKLLLEKDYHIIASEWERIAKINSSEGGVESFFDECRTTGQLFDRLLIPTVEDAMSGYSHGEFADTFESHRDSFRKYKELKEKIEENRKILTELDRYVREYARLDEKLQAYEASRAQAKAYWLLAGEQKEEEAAKLAELRAAMDECERKLKQHAQKRDSLLIARQRQELDALETKLKRAEEDAERTEARERTARQQYYSLRLADYKRQWKQADERLKYVQQELERLGSTQEESELEAAWASNSGQIRSLLLALEREWQAEEERLEPELDAQKERLQQEEAALRELSGKLNETNRRIASHASTIEARERDCESIRRSVLGTSGTETIEGSMSVWIERYRQLDDGNAALVQKNSQLAAAKEENGAELEQAGERLKAEYAERADTEKKLEACKAAHQALLAELAAYRPAWGSCNSVYDKLGTIEGELGDDVEKLSREKEAQLQKERLAFRHIDDYAGMDAFFADSYVAGLLAKWKDQFTLLESGIQYLQSAGLAGQASAVHPFWAATLITSEEEVGRLAAKLRQHEEELQAPIQIISLREASRLAELDTPASADDSAWVEPKLWRDNADAQRFAEWKRAIYERGEAVREARKAKEREWKAASDMEGALRRFIAAYPLDAVQELERQAGLKRELVRQLEEQAEGFRNAIRQSERELEHNRKLIAEQKEEMVQLQQRIEKGHQYLEHGKEIQALRFAAEQLQEQAAALESEIDSRKRAAEHAMSTAAAYERRLQELKVEKASLLSQELYAEVRDAEPAFAEHSLDWLKLERRDLHLKLNRISQSRQQLEQSRLAAKENKAQLEKELDKLRQEHSELMLDEALEFPASGEEQLSGLLKERKELEERLVKERAEFRKIRDGFGEQSARVKLMTERYAEEHEGRQPIVFFEALSAVEDQVRTEDKRLQEEQAGLTRMYARLQEQLALIDETIRELTPHKLMHGFENPLIAARTLTPEEKSDVSNDRMKHVRKALRKLSADHEAMQSEEKSAKRARSSFIDYCRKHIKDVKLREMAEQGVEQKETYADIAAFQRTMHSRIERVNHIAEETMRTHNQQLEQYIVHVHSHLKLIASELRDIPNKTRVKVEEQWKPIFSFHIPEWEEPEAKSLLRRHLEWVLDELDKDKYKDDSGQELGTTVRKDIEKWLDTKQLLQVVLQDRPMKVSCRKVTNENNVTKASFSWEQSNNWSGGEKWSKNMSLFLGLLNYVAEKRQHIQAHMKRHRTVILDNPFGKASSDHVLSPVFFIAEQLGFQIIAMTAHAEGKFLKDYFPVVFSCRLRQAASGSKLIMTKDKEINHAYFRDHDPASLERLEDVKQLELFL
ncbi:chromosome segregation ATPase [Paenibacillus chartarius]|uniref:Chromosome segregation ATPase n=1 Tax=Paenibacillus chartarius TaxID=747481 RepID=A0ABV6DIP0_9BACL